MKKSNIRIAVVFLSLVCLFLLVACLGSAARSDGGGNRAVFRGMSWGMSVAQVKGAETWKSIPPFGKKQKLAFRGRLFGLPARVGYVFDAAGKLRAINYRLRGRKNGADLRPIKRKLSDRFGSPIRERMPQPGDSFGFFTVVWRCPGGEASMLGTLTQRDISINFGKQ